MHPARRRVIVGIAVALLASVVLASQLLAAPSAGVFCSPVPPRSRTPVLTRFEPDQGRAGVAHSVLIMGRNLSKGWPITISLGGTQLTLATTRHPLDTWVFATIPNTLTAGTYDAQVCNSAGACSTLSQAYTAVGANALSLRSVAPAYGYANRPTMVLLTGNNFTSSTTFAIDTTPLTGVQVFSGRWAVAVVPAGLSTGWHNLSAQDPSNGDTTLPQSFAVLAARSPRGRR